MVFALMIGGAQTASAYYDDSIEYYDISGVFFVDLDYGTTIYKEDLKRGTVDFDMFTVTNDVFYIDGYDIYCNGYGADLIEVDQYDRNGNCTVSYYIAVVNDDEDWTAEGQLTWVDDTYYSINYKEDFYPSIDCGTKGNVYTYTIFPPFEGEAIGIYGNYGYTVGRGSDTVTGIVVDTNGNWDYGTLTVDVNYTFIQWIIVIVLFGWLWY